MSNILKTLETFVTLLQYCEGKDQRFLQVTPGVKLISQEERKYLPRLEADGSSPESQPTEGGKYCPSILFIIIYIKLPDHYTVLFYFF